MGGILCVLFRGKWSWARAQEPEEFINALLHKNDHRFGIQELIGPVLAFGTFPD